jgi:transposase
VVNPLFQESITTATRDVHSTTNVPRLHLAFELSWCQWKLAFTIGHGQPARLRTVAARDLPGLLKEVHKVKRRFGLPDDAAVVSCYEAGRDGFWLHRWLTSQGIANVIVDSASIEVNRRRRRAKTDRLDAAKLLSMLLRFHAGEHKVSSVVRVPRPFAPTPAPAETGAHSHRASVSGQPRP